MAQKFVTITGIMTYDEPITPPPTQPPLHPGWPSIPGGLPIPGWPGSSLPGPPLHPGWPTVPGWPGGSLPGGPGGFPPYPDGIWGPNDPRPTHPIQLPPWAGQPQPPWPTPNPPLHPGWPNIPGGIPIPGWPGSSLPGGPPPIAGWPVVPGWPGGSLPGGPGGFPTPPTWPVERPDFKPVGEPGPVAAYQWFLSPTYGWVWGVPTSATPPVEPPTEPPVEPPVEPTPA